MDVFAVRLPFGKSLDKHFPTGILHPGAISGWGGSKIQLPNAEGVKLLGLQRDYLKFLLQKFPNPLNKPKWQIIWHQDILRFDISMYNASSVQIVHLRNEKKTTERRWQGGVLEKKHPPWN